MDHYSVAETCERCGRPYALLIPEPGSDDLHLERVTTELGACVDCGRLVGRRCCWNDDGSCVDCSAQREAAGDTARSFAAAGMARAAVRKLDGLAPRFSAVEDLAGELAGAVDDADGDAWARAWLAAGRLRAHIDGMRRAAEAWIGRLPATDVDRAGDLRAELTAVGADIDRRWTAIGESLRISGGRVREARARVRALAAEAPAGSVVPEGPRPRRAAPAMTSARPMPPAAPSSASPPAPAAYPPTSSPPAPTARPATSSPPAPAAHPATSSPPAPPAPAPSRTAPAERDLVAPAARAPVPSRTPPATREPIPPRAPRRRPSGSTVTTAVVVQPVDRVAIPIDDLVPLGGGVVTTRRQSAAAERPDRARRPSAPAVAPPAAPPRPVQPAIAPRAEAPPRPVTRAAKPDDGSAPAPSPRRRVAEAVLAIGAVAGGIAVIGIVLAAVGLVPGLGDGERAGGVASDPLVTSSPQAAPSDTIRPAATVESSATPDDSGGSAGAAVSVDLHPVGPVDAAESPFVAATGGPEVVPVPSALDRSVRLHDGSAACLVLPADGQGVSFDLLLEGAGAGRLEVGLPSGAAAVLDLGWVETNDGWLRVAVVRDDNGAAVSVREPTTGAAALEQRVELADGVRTVDGAACFEADLARPGTTLLLDEVQTER